MRLLLKGQVKIERPSGNLDSTFSEDSPMTTTLQARSLSVSLTVADLAKSTRLYTEGLGFTLQEEFKMDGKVVGVMLESGGSGLMLGQDDFAKGRDRVKGVGIRLYVETEQDLQALASQARAAGLSVGRRSGPAGVGSDGVYADRSGRVQGHGLRADNLILSRET
jgi:catechol 2,3-dioxygenase-like lactoylglutathione lyase family enzyme